MTHETDSVDELTVLRCTQGHLKATKEFAKQKDGTIEKTSFHAGKQFRHEKIPVASIYDLRNVLTMLIEEPQKFVIRGQLKDGMGAVVFRRSQKENAAFDPCPRWWVMLDIDKLALPEGLDPIEDPDAVVLWVIKQLPDFFHGVTCFYKFSSSQNVPKKIGEQPDRVVSVHIWFWCNRSVSDQEWRKFFDEYPSPVDQALFNAVQMHYTASPIFTGFDDPLPQRHGLIKGEKDEVTLPDISTLGKSQKEAKPDNGNADHGHSGREYAGRNDALFRELCRIRRRLGYPEGVIRVIAHALNDGKLAYLHESFCSEGALEGSEVEQIIGSVMSYDADSEPDADEILDEEEALMLMNVQHAVVMESGKTLVITEQRNEALERIEIIRSSFTDIKNYYCRKQVLIGYNDDREPITRGLGKWWVEHPSARHYPKVVFSPQKDAGDAFNLWRGFGVEATEGDSSLFWEHVLIVICGGNKKHYRYVRKWLAQLVQQLDRQGETALVLRGERGVGKSMFVAILGKLFGQHYLPISNSRHLTGNFNAHLQDTILLFGDEAFWAGDKQGESVLKTLVTEAMILIEPKGVNSFLAKNHLHIILASNSDWVVPAGMQERRFFVLDVSSEKQGDYDYFNSLMKQMESGGYEALLYDLQHEDIFDFNVRDVPKTEALLEQKIRSLDPDHKWFFGKLYDGRMLETDGLWERQISKKDIQEDYVRTCTNMRVPRINDKTALGMFLRKAVPGLKSARQSGQLCYIFPPLDECRKAFAKLIGQEINWPDAEEEEKIMKEMHEELDDEPI